jgi:curved DNA-binding protein CbpA
VLGLVPGADLTDDDVRGAWRRVAAATHPDRPDGGDPPAFAEAAAAYTVLRTPFGRTEALADLSAARRPARWRWPGLPARAARHGIAGHGAAGTSIAGPGFVPSPGALAIRVLAAAGFCGAVLAIGGWQPAPIALACGAVITVLRGARR